MIFFVASEAAARENLVLFSKAVFQTMLPGMASPAFNSYEELFSYVDSICMTERLLLVIDEYPYLAASLLEDQMFRFWYRFVGPNISGIVRGIGEAIYFQQVKPQLNHYMGVVFEEICRQYLFLPEQIAEAPFLYSKVGRWWGNNPVEKNRRK